MELAEQLYVAQLLLSVAWSPRVENEEADALTNRIFAASAPAPRVQVASSYTYLRWPLVMFKAAAASHD